jgi:hypothetical protein
MISAPLLKMALREQLLFAPNIQCDDLALHLDQSARTVCGRAHNAIKQTPPNCRDE